MQTAEKLGRFGHHPDPATDFCVEVDVLEGEAASLKAGVAELTEEQIYNRAWEAAFFEPHFDKIAIKAKHHLCQVFPHAIRNPMPEYQPGVILNVR